MLQPLWTSPPVSPTDPPDSQEGTLLWVYHFLFTLFLTPLIISTQTSPSVYQFSTWSFLIYEHLETLRPTNAFATVLLFCSPKPYNPHLQDGTLHLSLWLFETVMNEQPWTTRTFWSFASFDFRVLEHMSFLHWIDSLCLSQLWHWGCVGTSQYITLAWRIIAGRTLCRKVFWDLLHSFIVDTAWFLSYRTIWFLNFVCVALHRDFLVFRGCLVYSSMFGMHVWVCWNPTGLCRGWFRSIHGVEGGNILRPGALGGTEFCNSIQFNSIQLRTSRTNHIAGQGQGHGHKQTA
jgi:hypothetical protein